MSTQHTPGPWEKSPTSYLLILGQSGPKLGQVANVEGESPCAEANARLIAAAPELLEHLIDCVRWMESRDQDAAWPENLVYKSAKEAIAKATGTN